MEVLWAAFLSMMCFQNEEQRWNSEQNKTIFSQFTEAEFLENSLATETV